MCCGLVAALRRRFPKVGISLHKGAPKQVAQMLIEEVAEVGLATSPCPATPNWSPCPAMVAARDRPPIPAPLAHLDHLSLEQLALEPLIHPITPPSRGRSRLDQAFEARRLRPNIVLEAIDSDVIKTTTSAWAWAWASSPRWP